MAVDLSVVIISRNTHDLLARCLESIFRFPPACTYDVWVVDNASSDGSAEMVRERFPQVCFIRNEQNVGFAAANNQGIRRSTGDHVLLLNSDTEVRANSLTGLICFAAAHLLAAIVGPTLLNPDGSFQAAWNDFPTAASVVLSTWGVWQVVTRNPYYPSRPPQRSLQATSCDWVGGACLLVRRAAIEQVGLLDEGFFMNSEEVDWCYRMWQSGWEVWYCPEVSVVHVGGASASRRSAAQHLHACRGSIRFLAKHRGSAAARLAAANYRLASLVKSLLYRAAFVLSRRPEDAEQARAHWSVCRELSWS
jgi:N-acetylglucosaminyl-diphospho-decaprenol L-rhamnosyltransferase